MNPVNDAPITTDILSDTRLRPGVEASDFPPNPPGAPALAAVDEAWVEELLRAMTPAQLAGQLLMTHRWDIGEVLIREAHVGGFVFLGNDLDAGHVRSITDQLQAAASQPLWFGIDSEAGLGARVRDATIFPTLMAHAAADAPELSEACGRITAAESHALGIHVSFGPVLDLNTDPSNPIISTRSVGDDGELLQRVAAAYLRGVHACGGLTCFKHWPGHGGTPGDSHEALPTVPRDRAALEQWNIAPFRRAVAAGTADTMMTAHVWYPAIHPDAPWPATLSRPINTGILRDDLGFEGVLFTDALNMNGVVEAVAEEGERAILAIESGADVILVPDDTLATHGALLRALESGRLAQERLRQSVRRVLRAKSRLRLQAYQAPLPWQRVLRHPAHERAVLELCRKAFTHVRGPEARLRQGERLLVLPLQGTSKIFYRFPPEPAEAALQVRYPGAEFLRLSRDVDPEERAAAERAIARADRVLVLGYDWPRIVSESQAALLRAVPAEKSPIYAGFGAPYHARQLPDHWSVYCGYCSLPEMQETAVEVLAGERSAAGKLPVRRETVEPAAP